MSNLLPLGLGTPKSFVNPYDLESGDFSKKSRKPKSSSISSNPLKMLKSIANRFRYLHKLHPFLLFFLSLSFGLTVLLILSFYDAKFRVLRVERGYSGSNLGAYPFKGLRNLVMVAGHSVYTSSSCGKVEVEESWFLEGYQRHPGQAATFLMHIREGVEIAARDEEGLLLFSGGETRRDAGPRSEAQSYWAVAESKGWFGRTLAIATFFSTYKIHDFVSHVAKPSTALSENFGLVLMRFENTIREKKQVFPIGISRFSLESGHKYQHGFTPVRQLVQLMLSMNKQGSPNELSIKCKQDVRRRALTEEHARDSFENLLFSVCRFRELTGTYPHNITVRPLTLDEYFLVISYDFKKERFADLHRVAIGFPEARFFYSGTPASSTAKELALKGEALVRAQFSQDPHGCSGSLHRKKLGRDPFHRSIPYPNGCPELQGMFRYCGTAPYPGALPWTK
ncbi:hypothetical protein Sjap_021873 [Stephania japonica]|uniref:Uncharacterized protein n=1 Tax=Stephania japonica TaxID=461633 RepID=A0AAP0HTW2_9MAGN